MLWLLWSILAILALVAFDKWFKDEDFAKVPGPKGTFFVRNSLDFLMNPVKLFYRFRNLGSTNKDLYKIELGPRKFLVVYNPEDVETIISTTKHNSKGYFYSFIEPWLKQGLLLSDGAKWQQRRKILTPAFHFNILRHFNTVLEENSRKLVEQLEPEVGKQKTNVSEYITNFTLHSICETAMGTKLDEETLGFSKNYKDAICNLGNYAVHRAQRVWMYPDLIYAWTTVGRLQKNILQHLRAFRDKVINKRRAEQSSDIKNIILEATSNNEECDISLSGKKRLAMLDLLLQAEKEGVIDAQGIGEEVDTFIFEGHDTTATALQFTFMLLANHPDIQNKAAEECIQVFGTSDREASTADLSQLKYLECCIKESLRLYPPVFFFIRSIKTHMKLKDYDIPAGTECAIMLYDLHRRKDVFSEPLEFKPERFMGEHKNWHTYAYIPFSAGPRNCIGQKFAMMEMKLALSAVLRRYKLLPVTTPQDVIFVTNFILRPQDPIYVKIENRQSS